MYIVQGTIGKGGIQIYKHHEETIKNVIDYFKKQGAVVLILGGSVAKGTERVASDLGVMV